MSSMKDHEELIQKGIAAGDVDMNEENAIWCQHSSDKVDIAQVLMKLVRQQFGLNSTGNELRALSIGCGSEPQFQILESAFRGGLYLLDIDPHPLSIIKTRIKDLSIDHVQTIEADYNKTLLHEENAREFKAQVLGEKRLDLIVLHHSLYYCNASVWEEFFNTLSSVLLSKEGGIHAVMMSSRCDLKDSTTWLYNHFAGKYFGVHNDQDLKTFGEKLHNDPHFRKSHIHQETHKVKFFINDFEKFMAVIWMILLYPNVHDYSPDQKREISEYIYDSIFKPQKPLIQEQDHLIITR